MPFETVYAFSGVEFRRSEIPLDHTLLLRWFLLDLVSSNCWSLSCRLDEQMRKDWYNWWAIQRDSPILCIPGVHKRTSSLWIRIECDESRRHFEAASPCIESQKQSHPCEEFQQFEPETWNSHRILGSGVYISCLEILAGLELVS